MLGVARRRAEIERVPNATFLLADAQLHPFPAESFDLVVSRHGTMFFGDPVAAFRSLARALRPGGGLTLRCGEPLDDRPPSEPDVVGATGRSLTTYTRSGGPWHRLELCSEAERQRHERPCPG
jgi:ubiquinone/menaquinone biosynthesis C-methylase UbiE